MRSAKAAIVVLMRDEAAVKVRGEHFVGEYVLLRQRPVRLDFVSGTYE